MFYYGTTYIGNLKLSCFENYTNQMMSIVVDALFKPILGGSEDPTKTVQTNYFALNLLHTI